MYASSSGAGPVVDDAGAEELVVEAAAVAGHQCPAEHERRERDAEDGAQQPPTHAERRADRLGAQAQDPLPDGLAARAPAVGQVEDEDDPEEADGERHLGSREPQSVAECHVADHAPATEHHEGQYPRPPQIDRGGGEPGDDARLLPLGLAGAGVADRGARAHPPPFRRRRQVRSNRRSTTRPTNPSAAIACTRTLSTTPPVMDPVDSTTIAPMSTSSSTRSTTGVRFVLARILSTSIRSMSASRSMRATMSSTSTRRTSASTSIRSRMASMSIWATTAWAMSAARRPASCSTGPSTDPAACSASRVARKTAPPTALGLGIATSSASRSLMFPVLAPRGLARGHLPRRVPCPFSEARGLEMKRIVAFGIVGVLALVGVACDDDGGGGGNDQAFCDLNTELSESDEEASDEQLDELADVAPEEIRDDARAILDHIKEEGQGSDLPDDLDD